MQIFLINSLAAAGQCKSLDEVERLIADIVECFEYISPALQSGRAMLLHDPFIDNMCIIPDEPFISSISRLGGRRAPDLRRKWYLYTKNRASSVSGERLTVSLKAAIDEVKDVVEGLLVEASFKEAYALLSFGGSRLLECDILNIESVNYLSQLHNAHCKNSILKLLPRYKASAKHRKESYFDYERNESVAAMPLSDLDAQELLLRAIKYNNDYWGRHQNNKNYFRFKLTLENEYHGFEVSVNEVPPAIVQKLR